MATRHLSAGPGDFAPTVLMPGDPLRAQYIAEHYLEAARRVNEVRNAWGYTGRYNGHDISVMASGMGIPSASIYATELIRDYDVQRIIRVGSCGAVHPDVKLRDIVIAMGACTDSAVNRIRFGGYDFAAIASFNLLRDAVAVAERGSARFHVGNLFSSDLFYTPDTDMFETMASLGVLAVEMEAAGLYGVAAEFGAQALAICTVSDDIPSGEALSAQERQTTFDDMIRLSLDTAVLKS